MHNNSITDLIDSFFDCLVYLLLLYGEGKTLQNFELIVYSFILLTLCAYHQNGLIPS